MGSPQGEGARNVLEELHRTGLISDEKYQTEMNLLNTAAADLGDKRFMENIIIPVDFVQALFLIKLMKEGRYDDVKQIFKTRDDNIAKMVTALAQAGTGNIITAWTHSHIIAQMLEHNYLIRKGGAKSIVDGASWLSGALAVAEVIGDFSVPSTLVFSAYKGASPKALADILKAGK